MKIKKKKKLPMYPYGGNLYGVAKHNPYKEGYNVPSMSQGQMNANMLGNTVSPVGSMAGAGATIGGPIGAGVGAGVGLITGVATSIMGNKAQKKAQEDAQKAANEQLKLDRMDYQNNVLYNNVHSMQGTDSFYGAFGTRLPVKKAGISGQLMPVGQDGAEVVGPSHAGGGVDIANQQGEPIANVEGSEFIYEDKVFSARIPYMGGTFADEAKKLTTTRAIAESSRKVSKDLHEKNGYQRTMDIADKKLEELFNAQEQIKQALQGEQEVTNEGLPQAQYGYRLNTGRPSKNPLDYEFTNDYSITDNTSGLIGRSTQDNSTAGAGVNTNIAPIEAPRGRGLGDKIAAGAAVLDNITNAISLANTPDIPKPRLNRAIPMKTTYDNRNELNAIQSGVSSSIRDIEKNALNTNIAGILKTGIRARGMTLESGSHANRENIETGLINADRMNMQGINQANQGILQQRDYADLERSLGIQAGISANVANLGNDVQMFVRQLNQKGLDKDKMDILMRDLELLRQKYPEGTYDRNILDTIKAQHEKLYGQGYTNTAPTYGLGGKFKRLYA